MKTRCGGAALVVAGLFLIGHGAEAATFVLKFDGHLSSSSVDGGAPVGCGSACPAISGQFTLNGAIGTQSFVRPDGNTETDTYFADSSWSLTLDPDGNPDHLETYGENGSFGESDLFPTALSSAGGSPSTSTATFFLGNNDTLQLDFAWQYAAQLLSLSSFPASDANPVSYTGVLRTEHQTKTYFFTVSAYTAVTPIPATLPLFLTALAGLGALRYRASRSVASRSAMYMR